jgi:hypothetical protein
MAKQNFPEKSAVYRILKFLKIFGNPEVIEAFGSGTLESPLPSFVFVYWHLIGRPAFSIQ